MTQTQSFDLTDNIAEPKFAMTQFSVEEFHRFWPQLEEMLDCVPHTWKLWTKPYIIDAVESAHLQFWGLGPPPNAVLVFFTQISVYARESVLVVPWGAGSFKKEMLPLLHATLTNYARLNGCGSIEVRGRPGWDKHFRSVGMKREFVTWSLPVSDVRIN